MGWEYLLSFFCVSVCKFVLVSTEKKRSVSNLWLFFVSDISLCVSCFRNLLVSVLLYQSLSHDCKTYPRPRPFFLVLFMYSSTTSSNNFNHQSDFQKGNKGFSENDKKQPKKFSWRINLIKFHAEHLKLKFFCSRVEQGKTTTHHTLIKYSSYFFWVKSQSNTLAIFNPKCVCRIFLKQYQMLNS